MKYKNSLLHNKLHIFTSMFHGTNKNSFYLKQVDTQTLITKRFFSLISIDFRLNICFSAADYEFCFGFFIRHPIFLFSCY